MLLLRRTGQSACQIEPLNVVPTIMTSLYCPLSRIAMSNIFDLGTQPVNRVMEDETDERIWTIPPSRNGENGHTLMLR